MAEVEKCVILGSGCAGLTAAVYAARGMLHPLVFEGAEPGGQLSLTSLVENFPGFPEGIGGLDLTESIKRQAQRFGARFRFGVVTHIDFAERPFRMDIEDETEPVLAHSLIIASGARARTLDLPGEAELWGRGLSACATCDGAFFKQKTVAVVGGGDSAMEDAIYLTKFASEVHVVHRRDKLRASQIMQDRALANPQIRFHWNRLPARFDRDASGKVSGLVVRATDGGGEETIACDGVFYAIGHIPNTEMIGDALPRDAAGYLVADGVVSGVPGVYIAGDVSDRHYQQAITAAGTGCAAAMEAEDWLQAEGLIER